MDKNISETIKVSFDTLKETRLKIKQTFGEIDSIKNDIKQNYIQYIQKESENFFGLDSFHFQNKAIELEYTNMLHLYHFIDNRIYGDYYKLFIMIHESLKTQLTTQQVYKLKELQHLDIYPLYKDLEPFKIYEFDLINQIHQDIILVLASVKEMVTEIEASLKDHQKHLNLGMNIDNYVINQKYKNNHLKMSNDLHENYLYVFHNYHQTWLHKYYEKIELFFKQICHHKENQDEMEHPDIDETTHRIVSLDLNETIEPILVSHEENIEPLPQQEVLEPIPSVEEQEQDVPMPQVVSQEEEKKQDPDKSTPPVVPQEEEKEDSVPEQTPSLEPIPEEEEEHEGLDISANEIAESDNETRPHREPTPPLVEEPCAPSEKEENKDTNSQSETTPRKNNQKKNNKKNNKKK